MALSSRLKYYATNTQDAIDKFKDTMVTAGWTLYDDRSGASPYAYVMKSQGESGAEWPCYLYMRQATDMIEFWVYADWNATTHVGTYCFGNTSFGHLDADDNAQFYIWCSADKDSVVFVSYIAGNHGFVLVGLVDPICDDADGTLASAASSGSSVVLTLGSGEASGFIAGKNYQLLDGDNRQWVEVSAVNTGANQVTIATLSYTFASGAVIGNQPHRWVFYVGDYDYGYKFQYATNGSGDNTVSSNVFPNLFANANIDPDQRSHQKYIMHPLGINDTTNLALSGYMKSGCNYLKMYIGISSEHTVSVGDKDSGTSSGANSTTTLNDTAKSWATNEWAGKILIITGGTGAGQYKSIVSNTATQLTVSTWGTTPDGTSTYTICDEGWCYLYMNNATHAGAIRVI